MARATGRQPGIIGMSFTTDARFVRNQAGIPTVVCGPGAVDQAHGNDECVAVDRLVDATAAYAELLAATASPARSSRLGLPRGPARHWGCWPGPGRRLQLPKPRARHASAPHNLGSSGRRRAGRDPCLRSSGG